MSQDLDLALVGARVRTLDPRRPRATAIGIRNGVIAAVGDDADVRTLCAPSTEVVDLDGAAVVPGLIDSHMHPFMGAINARGADLLDAHTLDDVLGALQAERAKCRPGEWIQGWGLDYNVFEQTGISSAVIEEAVGGAPAALTFMDFHTMLASEKALQLAGIDGPREFVEHAEIVCVDGRPTGELHERGAMHLLLEAMPPLTATSRYELCAAHLRALAAVGITGTHAMDGRLETLDLLRELESRGDLVTRILTPFTIEPDTPEEMWERYAAAGREHGHRWRAGVAKFFIDGVIDSGTGWLVEPDTAGDGTSSFWPDVDRYRRAVRFFAERGFQCVTHATGDRGVREALDTYASVPAPRLGLHRVEHIETLQPEDLPRFAAEGVVASMQAQHMMWLSADRSDNWSRRLGAERCGRAFLIRSLLESGATVALGSDWPVARYDPREGMAAARLRRPPLHPERPAYDDQALSAVQALEGYTTGAAATVGDGERLGRIRTGFAADLTVMALDPADADPDELVRVPVLMSIVDGEVVHRA
ncbi:MAG TPA: amidohydrolase [Solirubrobacteraceae bacterium]|nr:amidohydrolase [Solirubrobacteraceae bacterium]